MTVTSWLVLETFTGSKSAKQVTFTAIFRKKDCRSIVTAKVYNCTMRDRGA